MDEAATKAPPNVNHWNVVSAHSDPSTNTGDGLFRSRKPQIVKFDFEAQR